MLFLDIVKLKRFILRFCWIIQVVFFAYGYFYSFKNTQDVKFFLNKVNIHNKLLEEKKIKVAKLQEKLNLWYHEPWLYEKRARKFLKFGKPEEEHFLID